MFSGKYLLHQKILEILPVKTSNVINVFDTFIYFPTMPGVMLAHKDYGKAKEPQDQKKSAGTVAHDPI